MKAAAIPDRTHNPFDEASRVSCLRENLTSSSEGEGLETGRCGWLVPRQSFTRPGLHRPRRTSVRTRQTRPLYLHGRGRRLPRPRPCPSVSPLRRVKGSFAGLRPPLTRLRGRLPWA
jgi:hypothetical protein